MTFSPTLLAFNCPHVWVLYLDFNDNIISSLCIYRAQTTEFSAPIVKFQGRKFYAVPPCFITLYGFCILHRCQLYHRIRAQNLLSQDTLTFKKSKKNLKCV